jgi:2-O-(6-phospho-alpha-D-mannosyl)-D-glycerate hydrolase
MPICHVISNTHWDREWRYPFQSYRMDLVDMTDRLLDLMERRKDYRAFVLDCQTVLLEDYLEIRPENEDRIRSLAQEGRLKLGPWHTLPDMWCCPGEALVRNLFRGHRVASRFGPVMKVGYTPFSNGQISQLPQIYQGFGIDSCLFYRGVGKHVAKSEFLWKGADGTEIFGFRFGDYARYNHYYLLYRPGLLGRTTKDRDCIWDPKEIPWRVASDQAQDRQFSWLRPAIGLREEMLDKALEEAKRFTEADATTKHLLFMMGHDHSWALEEELDLIEASQRHLEGDEIHHSSFEEYLAAFREEAKDLEVLRGEMRHANREGLWTNLFALILSCRLYLKQRNAQICAKVLGMAEPLAAAAWIGGSEYPSRYLDIAWNQILINQAHDAIGGCSVDPVHEAMMVRWQEVETIADEITRRSMRDLIGRIDGSWLESSDLQLTVFNPATRPRSGVFEFTVDLPTVKDVTGPQTFAVENQEGRLIPAQILGHFPHMASVEGGYELPMPLYVERFRVALDLRNLPALGHEALRVRPGAEPQPLGGSLAVGPRALENEFLRAEVNANGTLRLTDKRSGRVIDGLGLFEDTAEFGDPWNRVVPEGDTPILSDSVRAECHPMVGGGALVAALRVNLILDLPNGEVDGQRSPGRIPLPISIIVRLRRGSPALELTVHLDNRVRDHRLRLLFPSGLANATHSAAEGQFDVVERPIETPNPTGWKEPPYTTHPMWNFVDVSDGKEGFAVINDGLTEFEVIDDPQRTVAITLLRTFGKFYFERPTPGAQCLGEHTFRFLLVPHTGTWRDADLFGHVADLTVPPPAVLSAPTQGTRPHRESALTLSNPAIQSSGIKRSEDGESLIVRLWNPTEKEQSVTLTTGHHLSTAQRLTLEEKQIETLDVQEVRSVSLTLPPKRIETLSLQIAP